MASIGVIGSGYVGLVISAGFANVGHSVVCMDVAAERIERLTRAQVPFYEPDLEELVREGLDCGRLRFSAEHREAVRDADFVFICVNTPSAPDGSADLQYLRRAVATTGLALPGDRTPILVLKSTVPVGTADLVRGQLAAATGRSIAVVSNPEFLREGSAIRDFFAMDRVVVGGSNRDAVAAVAALYSYCDCPTIETDARTAEMIKYCANAFLATKVSFINEMGTIAEALGANIMRVAEGIGLDHRIGSAYLRPGLGFGGSCLPKDVRALAHLASVHGAHPQLLNTVLQINADQRLHLVAALREALGGLAGRKICLLGLSFKPSTDDLREAPAMDLLRLLGGEGAELSAFDPAAGEKAAGEQPALRIGSTPYEAAQGVDAVVLATELPQCVNLNFAQLGAVMAGNLLADGRNAWDGPALVDAGFRYLGLVGTRPAVDASATASVQP